MQIQAANRKSGVAAVNPPASAPRAAIYSRFHRSQFLNHFPARQDAHELFLLVYLPQPLDSGELLSRFVPESHPHETLSCPGSWPGRISGPAVSPSRRSFWLPRTAFPGTAKLQALRRRKGVSWMGLQDLRHDADRLLVLSLLPGDHCQVVTGEEHLARIIRAPWKGAVSQWVRNPPGNCRSSR